MKSIEQKLAQVEGLIGTKDVSAWEEGFLLNVTAIAKAHGTTVLTTNQVNCIDRIYNQHFS